MKKILFLIIMLCSQITVSAQMSRRAIEKYSTEAVKQIALTGKTPTIDVLDSLANNAEVSIEMLSRMGEPDDVRQQRACLRLIDDIVAYSLSPSGARYVDIVRQGLKKSIDRSYEPDVQRHVLEQLALVAKPNDAEHIAMYMELDYLAPIASQILASMSGIDEKLKEVAEEKVVVKEEVKKPQPVSIPLWTESLRREVESLSSQAPNIADSLIIMDGARKALPELLRLAECRQGAERMAVMARFLVLADYAVQQSELNGAELYLLLRSAEPLVADNVLRNQLILLQGKTNTVQAFVCLRKYSAKEPYADAMAIAVTELLAAHPELNRGERVLAMLYAAKQSFIRHYDEKGVDRYIDQVLAAIDNWKADGAFNLSHTEETPMGKRGFWVVHDELKDFDMCFDWKAQGVLTLSLRSVPVLKFDAQRGVAVEGEGKWHEFHSYGDWYTVNIAVTGDKIAVAVNGEELITSAQPATISTPVSGFTKLLADEAGATVRQYCFRKR